MSRRPKNPTRPLESLTRGADDVLTVRPVVWRIHRISGVHVLPWNAFRRYGPLRTARFDPHAHPVGEHPGDGITYAALDVPTSVAEVFQFSRVVTSSSGVHLTSWTPTRELRLLDLTGDWALRNSGSHSLFAAPKSTCRNWSREIHRRWPDLDGLWSRSTMTGQPMLALYEAAADSFPQLPAFTRPLDNPTVEELIAAAAQRLGYRTA